MKIKRFKMGDIILEQGETPKEMLILCKGECDLVYTKKEKSIEFECKRAHVDPKLRKFRFGVLREKKENPDRSRYQKSPLRSTYIPSYLPSASETFDKTYYMQNMNFPFESKDKHITSFINRKIAIGEPIGMRSLLHPDLNRNEVEDGLTVDIKDVSGRLECIGGVLHSLFEEPGVHSRAGEGRILYYERVYFCGNFRN